MCAISTKGMRDITSPDDRLPYCLVSLITESLVPDNGEFCLQKFANGELEPGPVSDFCSPKFSDSHLRVYALLLGDFEVDNYREAEGMAVLFAIFPLIGVIILVNVLIAVISSYE